MSALKILERAEQLGMLEPKLIADLRKQISESKWSFTPEAVVKLLVDRGHLTAFQARKLVADAEVPADADDDVVELEAVDSSPPKKPAPGKPKSGNDAIDLESALPPTPRTSVPEQVAIRPNQPVNRDYMITSGKPSRDEDDDGVELTLAGEPPAPTPREPAKPTPPKMPGKLPKKSKPTPPPVPEGLVPVTPPGLTPVSPPGLTPVGPPPGLTPVGGPPGLTPVTPPSLTPIGLSPVAPPGLTPVGLSPVTSPGLTPVGPVAMNPVAMSPVVPQMAPVGLSPVGPGVDLVGNSFGAGAGLSPVATYAPTMPEAPSAAIDAWGSVVEPDKTSKKKKIDKRVAPTWENPWLLIGGGVLSLLFVVLAILVFSLGRTSADKLLDAGNAAYKSGAYSQAIGIYDQFEKGFATDPNASQARVKRGMAHIRQVFDGQRDMTRALEAAREHLPKIEGEEKFELARAELESMLPDIADNFAGQAKATANTSQKDKFVKLADEALRLCDNPAYLPQSRKEAQGPRLEKIREILNEARRVIDQDTELSKAIEAMDKATKAQDTGTAYATRAELLTRYPGLEVDPKMVESTLRVSTEERRLVNVAEDIRGTVEPPVFTEGGSTVLAARIGDPVAELKGKTMFVGVNGSTFAIDGESGRVLWRRTMGAATRIPPVYVGQAGASDAIVSNEQERCVERIEAATGKALWRFPVGEPFFTPVVGGTEHVFITTESGVVHQVDLTVGSSSKRSKLPQKATSSVAYDTRRKVLYQVGESGSLFALAGDALGGRDGFYLGHKAGAVTMPPLVVSGHVVVCENTRRGVLVHILNTDKRGYGLKKAIEPIALSGQMVQPPASYGRRVVVLTSSGEALLLEIDINNDETPIDNAVREIARQPAANANATVVGYQLLDGPRLWIGDNRLARYELVASRSALDRGPASWDGDTFIAPLQKIEGYLVTVRRKGGVNTATVQLVKIETNEPLWSTEVGSSPQWIAAVGDKVHAITASGNHFVLPADALPVSSDTPASRSAQQLASPNFSQKASYGPRGVALVDPVRNYMLAYDPGGKTKPVATKMKLAAGTKQAGPIGSFGDGVLVPVTGGQIVLFDPVKGQPKAGVLPLFPEAAPGQKIDWLQPQLYGTDGKRFVATDSRRQLFLAGLVDRPQNALAEQARVEADKPFVGGLSTVADRLYAIQREDDTDTVVVYSMPGITEVARHKLAGRLGPRGISTAGDFTFVEVDRHELWAFEHANEVAWKLPLPQGALAADPRVVGSRAIVPFQSGDLIAVDTVDGTVKGATSVGEPLGPAIAETESAVYVGALSGSVHRVALPIAESGAAKP